MRTWLTARLEDEVLGGKKLSFPRSAARKMGSYIWPHGPEFPVTQYFGANPNNGTNPAGGHTGQDTACPIGTPIRACGDGVIEWADWVDDSWQDNLLWLRGGISVVLNCGDAEPTFVFGHLNATSLNRGDRVRKGDIIAYTGNTGYSSGPHLHHECLLPGFILNSPTLGRSDPRRVCTSYWTGVPDAGVVTKTVTSDPVASVRTAPCAWASDAPGYEDGLAKGASFVVQGYVKGQDVTGQHDDAWFKTKSGFYVWANAAGNDISDVKFLGDMSGSLPPKPAPKPTPAPTPAPQPAPQPTPAPTPQPTPPAGYMDGVDVASYQEKADLGKLPGKWVGIKVSEGVGWTDPALASNVAEARAGGKLILFYHFARFAAGPDNTGGAEAAYFLQAVAPYVRPGDVASLDVEKFTRKDGTVEDPVTKPVEILVWLQKVAQELRCIPPIYLNGDGIDNGAWAQIEPAYPLWYAYPSKSYPGTGFAPIMPPSGAAWKAGIVALQYAVGRLAGYDGDIDLDVWYDRKKWDEVAVKLPAPTPTPAPTAPSDDVINTVLSFLLTRYPKK